MNSINTWEELVEFAKGYNKFFNKTDEFKVKSYIFTKNQIRKSFNSDNQIHEIYGIITIVNKATYQQMADFIKIIGTKKGEQQ